MLQPLSRTEGFEALSGCDRIDLRTEAFEWFGAYIQHEIERPECRGGLWATAFFECGREDGERGLDLTESRQGFAGDDTNQECLVAQNLL